MPDVPCDCHTIDGVHAIDCARVEAQLEKAPPCCMVCFETDHFMAECLL